MNSKMMRFVGLFGLSLIFAALVISQVPSGGNNDVAQSNISGGLDRNVKVNVVKDALKEVGHKESDYTFDHFVANPNEAGTGAFGEEIRTPADAVDFLDSGTDKAEAVLDVAIDVTSEEGAKTTKSQLLDEDNWIAVQFNKAVSWEGNTYWYNGPHRTGTEKVDGEHSIAVIFVPPAQVAKGEVTSLFALRGACVNPQYDLPRPHRDHDDDDDSDDSDDRCVKPPRPSGGGAYNYNPSSCTWFKPGQSEDQLLNRGRDFQDAQDNHTSGKDTGKTKGADDSPSSSEHQAPPGGSPGESENESNDSGGAKDDDHSSDSNGVDDSGESSGDGEISNPFE